ncbi:hypothetical protein A2U01_0063367, partial [Trifolium medium]|nr:hypothetical protein [Trifolium medium]
MRRASVSAFAFGDLLPETDAKLYLL